MHYSKEIHEIKGKKVLSYQVENDINGNDRHVIHFLDLVTQDEIDACEIEVKELRKTYPNNWFSTTDLLYQKALLKARKVGGKIYKAKWFGGGFVFQSFNIGLDIEEIFA
tara:strand:+ start:255 stop:584 length:330 start_codon:yes stop_codon:yes gene_type:complete